MNPVRTLRRSLAGALALVALVAVPAGAHPFIAGGELPVDSLATMRLSMAHGCGGDDGGEEEPTIEVALEVPDWLRVVEVPQADGYAGETETADDGTVTTVVWTADGEGVPAPAFDLEVVASGEPGEARHLAVFQACENGSYRWVGTPDDPADDPAINVALVAADPDAPPPPAEEPAATEEPTEPTEAAPDDTPTDDASEPTDETSEPVDDATESAAEDASSEGATAADDGDDGGLSLVLLGGLVVVLLAAAAVLVARRRRGEG